MRTITRTGRERHEGRAGDTRRAPAGTEDPGRPKEVRGSTPDADRRVTAVAEPRVLIVASGPEVLLLPRFQRLIDRGCSALCCWNRSSIKGLETK